MLIQEAPPEWSDSQLGLDLDRPWEEINLFELMAWDAQAEGLDENQVIERLARINAVWSRDLAYWNKRYDLQALEAGLEALRDERSSLGTLNSKVQLGMGLVSYWLLLPAGAIWPMDGESPVRPDGGAFDFEGIVSTPGGAFRYGYMKGEFPVIEDWNAYRQASASLPESARKAIPTSLSQGLRSRLIDSFEYSVAMQRSTVPVPLDQIHGSQHPRNGPSED